MSAMKSSTRYFVMALVAFLVIMAAIATADAGRKKYKAKSDKAWIGIYMQDVDEDLAEAFNLDQDRGVFIADVVDDSPADYAGMRNRDVIISVDGKEVGDSDDLTDLLKDYEPGDSVTIKALRRNKEREFAIELGEEDDHSLTIIGNNGNVWTHFNNQFFSSYGSNGYLGVSGSSMTDQLAEYFGVRYGVLIEEVEEDSPAEHAGLKAGDVITQVDDEQIDSPSDLVEIIGDHEDGDEVVVTVMRDRSEQKFTATLEEGSHFGRLHGLDPLIFNVPTPSTPTRFYFDAQNDFQDEMEELQEELEQLKDELEVIREKLD